MKSDIIKQLSAGINPVLTLKKKSQIYNSSTNHLFLTARHPHSPYPIVEDTFYHLNPGDKITFNKFIPEGNSNWPTVDRFECNDNKGNIFFVFAKDVQRFNK